MGMKIGRAGKILPWKIFLPPHLMESAFRLADLCPPALLGSIMDKPRSIPLVNPVSIFLVVVGVFLLLGGLGHLAIHFAS
jgi:hypothetical protein